MTTQKFDLRGEDDGSTVELNKRDLLFYLKMVAATCRGQFAPQAMLEWTEKVYANATQAKTGG